jgi:hypothetical protein
LLLCPWVCCQATLLASADHCLQLRLCCFLQQLLLSPNAPMLPLQLQQMHHLQLLLQQSNQAQQLLQHQSAHLLQVQPSQS